MKDLKRTKEEEEVLKELAKFERDLVQGEVISETYKAFKEDKRITSSSKKVSSNLT